MVWKSKPETKKTIVRHVDQAEIRHTCGLEVETVLAIGCLSQVQKSAEQNRIAEKSVEKKKKKKKGMCRKVERGRWFCMPREVGNTFL